MKLLKGMNENVLSTLGIQHYICGNEYILSPYVVSYKFEEGIWLHNSLTEETILLDKIDEVSELFYIEHWWKIEKNIDPFSLVRMLRNKFYRGHDLLKIYDYIILSTSKCNARCWYCYENSERTKVDMSPTIANDVAQYIIDTHMTDSVSISWFGGEPLFNREAIDIITTKLYDNNINYRSSMTSNGYLFDTIDDYTLKYKWRLNHVQITIDGDESDYKQIKNYIYNDSNPFDKVVKNIKRLISIGIGISIRFNASGDNTESIIRAFHAIDDLIKDKQLTYYCNELYDCSCHYTEEELERIYGELAKIRQEINSYGRHSELTSVVGGSHCMKDSHKCLVINPNGCFTQCEHYISDADKIGDIYTGFSTETFSENEKWLEVGDNCYKCPLAPKCRRINCPGVGKCNTKRIEAALTEMIEGYREVIKKNDFA